MSSEPGERSSQEQDERRGTLLGAGAYVVWGGFPLYFHALAPAGPWEVLAHRILWTMLVCVAVMTARGQSRDLVRLLSSRRRLAAITLAGLVIAANWTLYVLAVQTGRTTEAALGYFLNPLVTVALGVVVLGEHLRPLQRAAVAVGALACLYLALAYGRPPWISLGLAGSFGLYGLLKKRLGGSMTALQSLSAETLTLTPLSLVLLGVLGTTGAQTFTGHGSAHPVLMVLAGPLTAVPLLMFAAAARRVPLVTIGLLQFFAPVLQLLVAVTVLHEHMTGARWVGFGIVWVALALLVTDMVRSSARTRRARRGPDPVPVG